MEKVMLCAGLVLYGLLFIALQLVAEKWSNRIRRKKEMKKTCATE